MWPFTKKTAVQETADRIKLWQEAADAVLAVKAFAAPKIDVGQVHFVLTLDDGSRETCVLKGRIENGEPLLATDLVDLALEQATKRGFWRWGEPSRIFIPLHRIKQITATTWPYEVERT
jgi:hypothetical protein